VFTDTLRRLTEEAIAMAWKASEGKIPAPIQNSKKCDACSLQRICLPKEIKQLSKLLEVENK